jgi:hypothetical protein
MMCMDKPRLLNFHKIHHNLDLKGVIIFLPILYFMIGNMDYIKVAHIIEILK